MSELSGGQQADRKGAAQDNRNSGSKSSRRRWKKKQSQRSSKREDANALAGEVLEKQHSHSVQRFDSPNSALHNALPPHKRRRRRNTRPGNKRLHEQENSPVSKPESVAEVSAKTHRSNAVSNKAGRNSGARKSTSNIYAALDLGTNNCRLLLAVPRQRGRFRVIDGFSRIVRLGEGLSQTGRLSDEAMDRAVEALKQCATKLKSREIRRTRLIATEACRQASNGEEFLERVLEETGLELEIVSRETEAKLAAEGCGSLMDRNTSGAVMFDIGGGSTELVLVHGRKVKKGRIKDRIEGWASLPMGVVTLAERFGGQQVSIELFEEMKAAVQAEINQFAEGKAFAESLSRSQLHLLGTSGTVTTLAGIHLELPRYERNRVDGLWMTHEEIDAVTESLLAMDYEQRKQNPCIGEERADLVLAGCAILEAIRMTWPADRLRVADRGLREGLLTEMMNADRAWKPHWGKRRNHGAGGNRKR